MTDQRDLASLRAEIDKLDDELIALLKKRQALVQEASVCKSAHKDAAYSQAREAFLLHDRAQKAAAAGLPPGLIEDLLRRLLRESYKGVGPSAYACLKPSDRPLVIVGGRGAMGKLFASYFERSGYKVAIIDANDWDKSPAILAQALAVFISVPIACTKEVIAKVAPLLPPDCVLCDFTSVKAPMVQSMLEHYSGPVLGLHPMFGPDIRSMVKQVIVCVGGRNEEQGKFILEQFAQWGANVCKCSPQAHDQAMSIIQALRHFTTYCYGRFLSEIAPDLKEILALSSPIYRLELEMVGRLFAQDPKLYADIIMSSQQNIDLIAQYLQTLQPEFALISARDKAAFKRNFEQTRAYFGDYAAKFLRDSGALLAKVQDERDGT